ncbi:MerR family transcriptional regulator [Vallitalea okinawensis]|uniref:MerR family transcriptional regulator n=1 Tax=Vallitalea okinawensis TaxID=2078660 RepID=UPI000CFD834F|nr:MerR family transcriptional regulator [Vallitalea okinawensis]
MRKRFRIGEIAKIKNIDAQTLRYYDKLGLLSPAIVDEQNRYRYYSEEQFIEVDRIKFYKMLGLSLEEVKKYKSIHQVDEAIKTLQMQKDELDNKIVKMQAVSKNLETIIERIEKTKERYENSGSLIEVQSCDAIYGVIGDCQTIHDWYEFEKKLLELTECYPNYSEVGHNHGLSFIYNEQYLNHVEREHLVKILMPIEQQFMNDPNVEEYSLGQCILTYHQGSYSRIEETFSKVRQYIKQEHLSIRGDIITTSIINSFIINNQDEFLIEIKIPVIN